METGKSFYGSSYCLSFIAYYTFSSPATSATTERPFSTQGFTHNKRRNKLLSTRKVKFKFVKQNSKLFNDATIEKKIIIQI